MNLNREANFLEPEFQILYPLVATQQNISCWVARGIANLIRHKAARGEMCVLGLATGATPLAVYRELVRLHKCEGLSFNNVITFNLDEYYGLSRNDANSYWQFMHRHLFNHIDIKSENINIPDGSVGLDDIEEYCDSYEAKMASVGGIDVQLLGIGRTGHIGFNEPGASVFSGTHLVGLAEQTRKDAAVDFGGIKNVPTLAITMGIKTILNASKIVLLAWGAKKASILQKALEGPIGPMVPASYLQVHQNVSIFIDHKAASCLSSVTSDIKN